MTDSQSGLPEARAELARKLNLLMEVIMAPSGKPATFPVIEEFLHARGLKISRARWQYMLSGTRFLVDDPDLLGGIADFFEVDHAYLLPGSSGEIPKKVEAALQYARAERLGEVRLFAARRLGDVSPEILETLTAVLDEAAEQLRKKQTNIE